MNTAAAKTRKSPNPTVEAAYYDRSFWDRIEERAEAKHAKRRAEMPLVDARLDQLSESFSDSYPL